MHNQLEGRICFRFEVANSTKECFCCAFLMCTLEQLHNFVWSPKYPIFPSVFWIVVDFLCTRDKRTYLEMVWFTTYLKIYLLKSCNSMKGLKFWFIFYSCTKTIMWFLFEVQSFQFCLIFFVVYFLHAWWISGIFFCWCSIFLTHKQNQLHDFVWGPQFLIPSKFCFILCCRFLMCTLS
jgi:hypothetical protein